LSASQPSATRDLAEASADLIVDQITTPSISLTQVDSAPVDALSSSLVKQDIKEQAEPVTAETQEVCLTADRRKNSSSPSFHQTINDLDLSIQSKVAAHVEQLKTEIQELKRTLSATAERSEKERFGFVLLRSFFPFLTIGAYVYPMYIATC